MYGCVDSGVMFTQAKCTPDRLYARTLYNPLASHDCSECLHDMFYKCVCECLYEGISLVSCPVKQMHPNIAWKTGQRTYTQIKKTVKHKKHTMWKWISTV